MTGAATTVAVPAGRGGPDVVTFGEALVVFVAPPSVPLASATRFHRTVAGAEFNVAIGLARLGHEVSFIGRVGDDPHGQLALRALRAERVNTDGLLVDASAPTGMPTARSPSPTSGLDRRAAGCMRSRSPAT